MLNSRRIPYTRIRNVQRVRRPLSDGRYNYHHYHRPTRTKLPGKPGSPEFMAVYEECERQLTAGVPLHHRGSRHSRPEHLRQPKTPHLLRKARRYSNGSVDASSLSQINPRGA